MKTLQIFVLSLLSISLSLTAVAQKKTETFAVAGVCGMCKKKIETAAKEAGAAYAVWNEDSKQLKVTYNSESANAAKIQQAIAKVGYDTPLAKASDAAYNSLHDCCKYDRAAANTAKSCCADDTCCAGKDCCANETCAKKDAACCTEGTCTHEAAHSAKAEKNCCAKH